MQQRSDSKWEWGKNLKSWGPSLCNQSRNSQGRISLWQTIRSQKVNEVKARRLISSLPLEGCRRLQSSHRSRRALRRCLPIWNGWNSHSWTIWRTLCAQSILSVSSSLAIFSRELRGSVSKVGDNNHQYSRDYRSPSWPRSLTLYLCRNMVYEGDGPIQCLHLPVREAFRQIRSDCKC